MAGRAAPAPRAAVWAGREAQRSLRHRPGVRVPVRVRGGGPYAAAAAERGISVALPGERLPRAALAPGPRPARGRRESGRPEMLALPALPQPHWRLSEGGRERVWRTRGGRALVPRRPAASPRTKPRKEAGEPSWGQSRRLLASRAPAFPSRLLRRRPPLRMEPLDGEQRRCGGVQLAGPGAPCVIFFLSCAPSLSCQYAGFFAGLGRGFEQFICLMRAVGFVTGVFLGGKSNQTRLVHQYQVNSGVFKA